jgi:RND family efflux transporter MFP subunit
VVQRWFVKPGQHVKGGATLAVLTGTEVAMARSEIKKCEANVRIAQINYDWSRETQANLTELLATLQQQPSVESIRAQFGTKRLGEHRDHLLTTYTQYVLANSVAKRSEPLGQQGVIAGRTVEARLGDRNVAATTFKSACEQSEFESQQQLAKSRAELDLANQQLEIAKDRLKMLLGPLAHKASNGDPGNFEVRAPFDGRVEVLHASPSSRLMQGDGVLTFADTTTLWVSALIHQHDWEALQVPAKETVKVMLPAMPDRQFSAKVSFVGPEVSPTTRAISLIAELQNQDGRFRPGMFAWVELPMESPRQALVVPSSAVQRHESETFVFVQVADNRYRRIDVSLGIETPDYSEVEQGLSAGQMVVDRGSFYLKSELLLEQEEE